MKDQDFIDYWKKRASSDLKVASMLYKIEKYLSCLSFCHNSIDHYLRATVLFQSKKCITHPVSLPELAKEAKLSDESGIINQLHLIVQNKKGAHSLRERIALEKRCTPNLVEQCLTFANNHLQTLERVNY